MLEKRHFQYRLALCVLALLSAILILSKMLTNTGTDASGLAWMMALGEIFLLLLGAGLNFLSFKPIWRHFNLVITIVTLGLTLASSLMEWPLFVGGFGKVLIFWTLLIQFIYLSFPEFKTVVNIILFFLRLMNTVVSLYFGPYLLLVLLTSGGTLLSKPEAVQNAIVISVFITIFLNICYAIVIWFKFYRSWWAWLISTLFCGELLWFIASFGIASGDDTLVWVSIMVIVIIIAFGLPYTIMYTHK